MTAFILRDKFNFQFVLYVILILLQLIKGQIKKSNEEILKATAVNVKWKENTADLTLAWLRIFPNGV